MGSAVAGKGKPDHKQRRDEVGHRCPRCVDHHNGNRNIQIPRCHYKAVNQSPPHCGMEKCRQRKQVKAGHQGQKNQAKDQDSGAPPRSSRKSNELAAVKIKGQKQKRSSQDQPQDRCLNEIFQKSPDKGLPDIPLLVPG